MIPLVPFVIGGAAAVWSAVKAKDWFGYAEYAQPPKPSAPPVPQGGYTGAVTDPRAVDKLVAQSMANTKAAYSQFFEEQAGKVPNPDDTDYSLLWIGGGLLAAALVVRGIR